MRPILPIAPFALLLCVVGVTPCTWADPVVVTVPGTSAIWLAGQPVGASEPYSDIAGPILVDFSAFESKFPGYLCFHVTGTTARDPDTAVYPMVGGDGEPFGPDSPPITIGNEAVPLYSLSAMRGQIESLVGVFLDSKKKLPTPPMLDFSTPESVAFTVFAPKVQQVFFIGDGVMGTGDGGWLQWFKVPEGADCLYLGLFDMGNRNNVGALTVTVGDSDNPTPEPSTLVLCTIGLVGLIAVRVKR